MIFYRWVSIFIFVSATLVTIDASADVIMTNADVIKLVKSGLGEATILQAIDASTSKFSTSADALIVLKRSGVSDTVVQRMITKNSGQSLPVVSTATSSGGQCRFDSDDVAGAQQIVDGENKVSARPIKNRLEGDSAALTLISTVGSIATLGFIPSTSKVKLVIDGSQSRNRLRGSQPVFPGIAIRTDLASDDAIQLLKLQVGDGTRYISAGEGSVGIRGAKADVGFPSESVMPLSLELRQKGCTYTAQGGATYTMNVYVAKSKSKLTSGEYVLVLGKATIDFGVD